MSQNTKKTSMKGKKKKDPARRKQIIGAVIALLMVLAMVISIFEGVFENRSAVPTPETSLRDNIPAVTTVTYNI